MAPARVVGDDLIRPLTAVNGGSARPLHCRSVTLAPYRQASASQTGSIEAMSMSPRYDIVALGELIIDLVPVRGGEGQAYFAPKPGGAPGNVAVGVARLGGRAAMLS